MLPRGGGSTSGYFAWRNRPPSVRALRHAWLINRIRAVHLASQRTYGFRRVHVELRLDRGLVVGYRAVEMMMRRAGIRGLPGSRRPRRRCRHRSRDLVNRDFARSLLNQWVTDVERHEALTNGAMVKGHRCHSVAAG
ncbi:IS3 family transposase [Polymorphospora lycopeni]|uniref:IS3 family transposase n=1 Tax=Polymorphospora lycopeni TaxID=3140240 RepID=A0ABV5CZP3_9ACTN